MPDATDPRRASRGSLAVLAKAPIPGYAKTRLIPRLGADGAAALHASLVERALRTAASAGFADLSLWCAPDREHPFFAACQALGPIRLLDQPAGDLGIRMLRTFEALLPSGGPGLLIGTDCPELSIVHLRDARAALTSGADAVFIPALDGGYVLVGLRRVSPALFASVPWGTSEVMAETRARLRDLRWTWRELAPLRDLDTPEDLDWIQDHGSLECAPLARSWATARASGPPPSAPRRHAADRTARQATADALPCIRTDASRR